MSHYQLRDDLPLPRSRDSRRLDYPLGDLKVGQCLIVSFGRRSAVMTKARLFANANPGWAFKGRVLVVDGKKVHGIWCVARPDTPEAAAQPTPAAKMIRREPEFITTSSSPTAHQQKLREVARLQPTGKRQAHVVK